MISSPTTQEFVAKSGLSTEVINRTFLVIIAKWHDCRHTFASRLVMAGVDLYSVAKLLGHKDIKVTMRYAHLAPGYLKKAVNVLCLTSPLLPQAQSGTS
jgi:site-specific recombinase XerD